MKRGKPLRRSALRPDPERVREFMQRGRGQLRRSSLARKSVVRRVKEGPLSPQEWRKGVYVASGGRCVMTGTRARDVDDPAFHAHHCLPKRELRRRGLFGYVWDARNGILLTEGAHRRHEDAVERVPAERLPAAVWVFCAELDALEGTEWATQRVLRDHPATGSGRT